MPPRVAHEWTSFELHTLHCLMARNIHLYGDPSRIQLDEASDATATRKPNGLPKKGSRASNANFGRINRKQAHLDVATLLNASLNGEHGGHDNDIEAREIGKMIERIEKEQAGGLAVMERVGAGRMTRLTKRVLQRKVSFRGDLEEWERWRRREVEREEGVRLDKRFAMLMDPGEAWEAGQREQAKDAGADAPWGEDAAAPVAAANNDTINGWGAGEEPAAGNGADAGWGETELAADGDDIAATAAGDDWGAEDAAPEPQVNADMAGWGDADADAPLEAASGDCAAHAAISDAVMDDVFADLEGTKDRAAPATGPSDAWGEATAGTPLLDIDDAWGAGDIDDTTSVANIPAEGDWSHEADDISNMSFILEGDDTAPRAARPTASDFFTKEEMRDAAAQMPRRRHATPSILAETDAGASAGLPRMRSDSTGSVPMLTNLTSPVTAHTYTSPPFNEMSTGTFGGMNAARLAMLTRQGMDNDALSYDDPVDDGHETDGKDAGDQEAEVAPWNKGSGGGGKVSGFNAVPLPFNRLAGRE